MKEKLRLCMSENLKDWRKHAQSHLKSESEIRLIRNFHIKENGTKGHKDAVGCNILKID